MASHGQVVGGDFMNKTVDTNQNGELVVNQAETFKLIFTRDRKLNATEVIEWEEVIPEPRKGPSLISAVGQAVAGAALPRVLGKAASAAIGAGVDAANRNRLVRVDWVDGKTSLIKLPPKLFTDFEVVLEEQRVEPVVSTAIAVVSPEEPLDPTGQVLTQVAGLIKDRRGASMPQVDPLDQIAELAELRDRGILTEAEFLAKKAELLGRL